MRYMADLASCATISCSSSSRCREPRELFVGFGLCGGGVCRMSVRVEVRCSTNDKRKDGRADLPEDLVDEHEEDGALPVHHALRACPKCLFDSCRYFCFD